MTTNQSIRELQSGQFGSVYLPHGLDPVFEEMEVAVSRQLAGSDEMAVVGPILFDGNKAPHEFQILIETLRGGVFAGGPSAEPEAVSVLESVLSRRDLNLVLRVIKR